jgi:hypothetical protein
LKCPFEPRRGSHQQLRPGLRQQEVVGIGAIELPDLVQRVVLGSVARALVRQRVDRLSFWPWQGGGHELPRPPQRAVSLQQQRQTAQRRDLEQLSPADALHPRRDP